MTWGLVAAFADGSSFASEVETFSLVDGVLTVKTAGLELRRILGTCIGVVAVPKVTP